MSSGGFEVTDAEKALHRKAEKELKEAEEQCQSFVDQMNSAKPPSSKERVDSVKKFLTVHRKWLTWKKAYSGDIGLTALQEEEDRYKEFIEIAKGKRSWFFFLC